MLGRHLNDIPWPLMKDRCLFFIRDFDKDFVIFEELYFIEALKHTDTGQGMYECVSNCLMNLSLPLNKLASIQLMVTYINRKECRLH